MSLTKDDYGNMLKLLTNVEIKGLDAARYVSVLASKIENRIATWVDATPNGFATAAPPKVRNVYPTPWLEDARGKVIDLLPAEDSNDG